MKPVGSETWSQCLCRRPSLHLKSLFKPRRKKKKERGGRRTSDRITLLSHSGQWRLFSRWKGHRPLLLNERGRLRRRQDWGKSSAKQQLGRWRRRAGGRGGRTTPEASFPHELTSAKRMKHNFWATFDDWDSHSGVLMPTSDSALFGGRGVQLTSAFKSDPHLITASAPA